VMASAPGVIVATTIRDSAGVFLLPECEVRGQQKLVSSHPVVGL
jgi:hypothetical protein